MNPLTNGSANELSDRERHEETSFCTTNCRSPSKSSNPPAISTIMTDSPTVAVIQPGLTVSILTITMHREQPKKREHTTFISKLTQRKTIIAIQLEILSTFNLR